MKRKVRELTPMSMARYNFRKERRTWAVVMVCVGICVFVQCLFVGISNGVVTETEKNPDDFENPVNLADAVTGWAGLMYIFSGLMMVFILASAVIGFTTERRKSLGILRAIGIKRGQMFDLMLIEAFLASIGAYIIGLFSALAFGAFLNLNYIGGERFGPLSTPFYLSPWLFFPLALILLTTHVSIFFGIVPLMRRSVKGVLDYE